VRFDLSLALVADPSKSACRSRHSQSTDSQQRYVINLFLRDSDVVRIPNGGLRSTF
jgi:hypothetical protein